MRNLSEECVHCPDNQKSMAICFDVCCVPGNLLDEIEKERNEKSDQYMAGYQHGKVETAREIFQLAKEAGYPEDLEESIHKWLNVQGYKF